MTAGEVLAKGRDCEILDYGPGKVLRRPFDGRSLAAEGAVMAHAHEHGFPVPGYHGEADGGIVIDRVDGPTMIDAMVRKPLPRLWARELAELHRRLHVIPAPKAVPRVVPTGDRLLHVDLHPLNVIMSKDGPMVIDWSNASVGEPAFDVAMAWVIMATSDIPEPQPVRGIVGAMRRVFVRHFVSVAGRADAERYVELAGDYRLGDRNQTERERARVRRLVSRTLTS